MYARNISEIPALTDWAKRSNIDVIWNILTIPEHLSLAHVPESVRNELPMEKLPREVRLALGESF